MNEIFSVEKGSLGEELGIEPGDILLSINGQAVKDIIDYKFLISDEYIELSVKKKDGQEWIYEVEKEYDEDLGLIFERPIIDKARSCANKCIFCFIDQLPTGMRETLYFKDDDSRLSFLQGNFITLTNMSDRDIDRIIRYRISPLNISVHTTDPELRVRMLGNKRAGNIFETLKKLASGGIGINCQIVLVKGVNDGEALYKTLEDLSSLYPKVRNVAVVPVGITRYREKLYPVEPFEKEDAKEVIDVIKAVQDKMLDANSDVFARAADEFYIMAGMDLPDTEHYGDYEQLEDGVGMVAYFMENIKESLKDTDCIRLDREVSVITGESAAKYIKKAACMIESKIESLKINVYEIANNFFGGRITVTGLLTGRDIIEQLKGKDLGNTLYLPSNLLKANEEILLDDISIDGLRDALDIDIKVCAFDGSDFLEKICE